MDKRFCIVIPSLKPNELFVNLLKELTSYAKEQEKVGISTKLIVVDDGSGKEYESFFAKAENEYGCIVLRHAVNCGKGRALKTAFNYFLNVYSDYNGVVTVDADGQHAVKDIYRCAKELFSSDSLVLGCRDFDDSSVPFKSRTGNKITRSVFHFLCGKAISDTQTGLRAIPTKMLTDMITISGERYEYETNMLIECVNKGFRISEVLISTIYIENNKGSHFNPLTDSIKVYLTFIKYIFASFSSFFIDVSLFTLFQFILKEVTVNYILLSTAASRIISSSYNYFINRRLVFSGSSSKKSLIKYYILALLLMVVSGLVTTLLFSVVPFNEVITKLIVDLILFAFSFYIQRIWVFK